MGSLNVCRIINCIKLHPVHSVLSKLQESTKYDIFNKQKSETELAAVIWEKDQKQTKQDNAHFWGSPLHLSCFVWLKGLLFNLLCVFGLFPPFVCEPTERLRLWPCLFVSELTRCPLCRIWSVGGRDQGGHQTVSLLFREVMPYPQQFWRGKMWTCLPTRPDDDGVSSSPSAQPPCASLSRQSNGVVNWLTIQHPFRRLLWSSTLDGRDTKQLASIARGELGGHFRRVSEL